MGASKELFMQTNTEDISEYFQWLSEQEWYAYVQQEERRYHKLYGYGREFQINWDMFKLKNT